MGNGEDVDDDSGDDGDGDDGNDDEEMMIFTHRGSVGVQFNVSKLAFCC